MNHPWSISPTPGLSVPLLPLGTGMQGWGHQFMVLRHEHPSLPDQSLLGCTPVTFGHRATRVRFPPSSGHGVV